MGDRPGLEEFLDEILDGGIDVVQLRDKNADARRQVELAQTFRAACDRHEALFIVNDRVDVALAAEADGVHLGQDDLDPYQARKLAGHHIIIGRSTHTRDDIERSTAEPIDYIAVGPVYETPTKPGRPAVGLGLLQFAAQTATSPWFAIGGVDETTLGDVLAAGATRVVVVRAITEAGDSSKATQALREIIDRVHV
ncbi:MAG: thiamine phosphate synthase [Actinomycetota bacterium]